MKPKTLVALVIFNVIWATNPTMGKLLMRDFEAMQTSWLRYASALVTLGLFLLFSKPLIAASPIPWNPHIIRWVVIGGLLTFFGSPILQYAGLNLAGASINSLMVAIEPLICILLAWFFLREPINKTQGFSIVLSLLGFAFLSRLLEQKLTALDTTFIGSVLLFFCLPCEGMYTIVSRKLQGHINSIQVLQYTLLVGCALFTIYVAFFTPKGLPDLRELTLLQWCAVIWLGPVATTVGYIYWTFALKDAPVVPIVLTLLVQPLWGSLSGYVILGETLNFLQLLGGGFIVLALLVQTDFKGRK